MKKLIIAAGLLMATSAYAQTEVLTGVTRGKDYGVVYSLPKTSRRTAMEQRFSRTAEIRQ